MLQNSIRMISFLFLLFSSNTNAHSQFPSTQTNVFDICVDLEKHMIMLFDEMTIVEKQIEQVESTGSRPSNKLINALNQARQFIREIEQSSGNLDCYQRLKDGDFIFKSGKLI